jgi:SOS response regulatory protein OraA/RecX
MDVYQKCLVDGFDTSLVLEILNNTSLENEENIEHDNQMLIKDYQKLKRNYQNDCDKKEFQVKLIRKLISKGYSYESINEIIRKDELEND